MSPQPSLASQPFETRRSAGSSGHQKRPALSRLDISRIVELLEAALGLAAIKELAPMQPGDVAETRAVIRDLVRDVGLAAKLHDPYARIELAVEFGRVGVCVVDAQTGELISEQLASATPHTVVLRTELPQERIVTIIIRNTMEGPSRVRLLKTALCERV